MNTPSLFLGILIATSCGLLFHLIRGGGTARLGLFVLTACVAFFIGHLVGMWLDLDFLRIGMLNLLPALLATALGLFIANLLAGPERKSTQHRRKR
jgi:H+/Cl- antiporter ClcA